MYLNKDSVTAKSNIRSDYIAVVAKHYSKHY